MGRAAARGADVVIVTSDNPRSEDPEAIIAQILDGIDRAVKVEPDRARAIARAVELAQDGDVVVIAGKGHEQGQEFAGGEAALRRRHRRPGGAACTTGRLSRSRPARRRG